MEPQIAVSQGIYQLSERPRAIMYSNVSISGTFQHRLLTECHALMPVSSYEEVLLLHALKPTANPYIVGLDRITDK